MSDSTKSLFIHQLVTLHGVRCEVIRITDNVVTLRDVAADGFTSNPNGLTRHGYLEQVKPA